MNRRQGKRLGSAQHAVLQILCAYGLTAETDVQHWATVASVAEMGNMTPATTRGALRGLQRACLVERRPAPTRRGRPTRAHVYALTPAGQKEAATRATSVASTANVEPTLTSVQREGF
jgi:DNA-binding MarR family transcriptional regulator